MRQWRTIALDRDGRTLHGRMAAPDEASVARQLRRGGAVPLEIKPDRQAIFGFALGGDALSRADLALVLRELATMLGAGQDLDHALQFIQQTAPNRRVRRVLSVGMGVTSSMRPICGGVQRANRYVSALSTPRVKRCCCC